MYGDDATGTIPPGGSTNEPGSGPADVADVSEPGSIPERGAGEHGSVRDVADSTGGETVGEAVSDHLPADAPGERSDAAGADGDRPADGQRRTGSTADWLKEKRQTMSALIDFLKKNGATDADLEQMKPMLDNPKFASAMEKEVQAKAEFEQKYGEASGKLSEFESQKNIAEAKAAEAVQKESELRNWWDTQASPAVEKIRQDNLRESEQRAKLEMRLSKAKELYGFDIPDDSPVAGIPAVVPGTGAAAAAASSAVRQDLPDLSKYVTTDLLSEQANIAGQAIAATQDLAFEHVQLFGYEKPVNFEGLRAKAIAERKPVREIWERELGVAGRRQELEAKRMADVQTKRDAELAAARQEGFEKGMSQSVNPMTREPVASRFGLSFTKRDETAGKPWDSASRGQDRLQKVVSTLAKQGAA